MHVIPVHTSTPYDVHVGTFLLERTGELLRDVCDGSKAAIVTDSNVGPLYADVVEKALVKSGFSTCVFSFEAGEERKRMATLVDCLEFLAEHELTRRDAVVALGGGVVGDLAGFAAATYLRGIKFAQVPTSLLAMVDSSVGGKTAVDLSAGKNLAGAFWQPSVVIADIGCLATLSAEQFADGCGEVIKHGVIADPLLFDSLEQVPLTLENLMRDVSGVEAVVARNVEIKRDVVDADERENGARKLLNFGHSIGHAVEALEEFRLGHGNCVSIGMGAISRATALAGVCAPEVPARIEAVCLAHGLATRTSWGTDEVFESALHDKKRTGATIDLVVPHEIGACSIERTPLPEFRAIIDAGLHGALPASGSEAE